MLCAQMDQVVIDPAGLCVPDKVQSVVSKAVQGHEAASTVTQMGMRFLSLSSDAGNSPAVEHGSGSL